MEAGFCRYSVTKVVPDGNLEARFRECQLFEEAR
jgi:hypothetical protein